jgi:hypothetical protein
VFRQDYLLRLIEQIAAALARMVGHNRKREYEHAISEASHAWSDVLGVPREVVDVVDTPTLAGMLREPDKMRAAAQLLVEEARAVAGKGDPLGGGTRYRRALELVLEARAIDPTDADDAMVLELSREVPPNMLDARYRSRA